MNDMQMAVSDAKSDLCERCVQLLSLKRLHAFSYYYYRHLNHRLDQFVAFSFIVRASYVEDRWSHTNRSHAGRVFIV